jgi:hypothetical protein
VPGAGKDARLAPSPEVGPTIAHPPPPREDAVRRAFRILLCSRRTRPPRAFYGIPLIHKLAISDLEPAEIMYGFSFHALKMLADVSRADEPAIIELESQLHRLWKRS